MQYSDLEIWFVAALRQAMAAHNMNQKELAEKSGHTQQTISYIFTRRFQGTERTRRSIAAAFGIGYEKFLKMGRFICMINDAIVAGNPPTCREDLPMETPQDMDNFLASIDVGPL